MGHMRSMVPVARRGSFPDAAVDGVDSSERGCVVDSNAESNGRYWMILVDIMV